MFSDISELIRKASIYNNPDQAYHNSFVSRFKMYRKTKIIKQRFLAIGGTLALIIVAFLGFLSITKGNIDIPTASGTENVKPPHTTR